MELEQTIELMQSPDYKERFMAEYYQTKIRFEKLTNMVVKWENLNFTPTCPKSTYLLQLEYMEKYLAVLELRAVAEGIVL